MGLMEMIDGVAQRAGAFGRMRFIRPVGYAESKGEVRAIYDQILAEYGLGGPFFVTSVSPPLLAATWGLVRTSFLESPLPRGMAEIVASAVARAEECPFCVQVHASLAHAAGECDTAALIAEGAWEAMAARDTPSDRLALWARDFVRGVAGPPPVEAAAAPHVLSTALLFVHITALVTVFQDEGLVAGGGGSKVLDGVMQGYMRRSLGKRMLRRAASQDPVPALPEGTPTPGAHDFATAVPALARGWASLDRAALLVGGDALSPAARAAVTKVVGGHAIGEPALDLGFVDEELAPLDDAERGLARLATVGALAPYRVTARDVDAAGEGGARGERWVAAIAYGLHERLLTLSHAQPGLASGRRAAEHRPTTP